MSRLPVVGLTACRRTLEPHEYHVVGDKYVTAVREVSAALPVSIPSEAASRDPEELVHSLDGIVLTGSYSNVEPARYGSEPRVDAMRDPHRDHTAFLLLEAALAAGCPVFAICRGLQEMNVAFGGTLHEALHELPGKLDHREDPAASLDDQYAPAHPIAVTSGGLLEETLRASHLDVNSVHAQGIDRLGDGLKVEATAPDGVVEAVSVADHEGFALAVQWHPEYKARDNPHSLALFRAFGEACRVRAADRSRF